MDDRFQKAENEYLILRGKLEAGRLTREQFEAALKELMPQDAQGRYWMLGADSGKWYVHDGKTWVQAEPPGKAVAPTDRCPKCGQPITPGEVYCGNCGQPVVAAIPGNLPPKVMTGTPPPPPTPVSPVYGPPVATPYAYMPPPLPQKRGRTRLIVGLVVGVVLILLLAAALLLPQSPVRGLLAGLPPTPAPPTASPTTAPTPLPATATSVVIVVTATPLPPTATRLPPTATPVVIVVTATPLPPTATPVPPTATRVPPTATLAPPTATPAPTQPPTPVGRIVFTTYDPGARKYELYIINTDGSGRRKLVDEASEPAFSPDGSRIVFYSWKDAGLFLMNADGSGVSRLTKEVDDATPSWSVLNRIAFGAVRDRSWRVWSMDQYGADVRRLTDYEGKFPSWSPDGKQIVYQGCVGGDCGLTIINADGSGRYRITTNANDSCPAWSPDGSRIAFVGNRDGNWEIYTITPDGANLTRLTTNPTNDGLPAWTPDGRLAFRSDRGGSWGIWIMNADGSGAVKIADAPVNSQRWQWEKMSVSR